LQTQPVSGSGFRFEAPADWTVTREAPAVSAASGKVDLVEVRTFRLVKPYRVALFDATTRELDGVIDRIARQLSGKVASRETVTIAGRRARAYRVDYDGKVQEIAFVLRERSEYQLLCRREDDGADDACRVLRESFELR
jgi:hypothetical protein